MQRKISILQQKRDGIIPETKGFQEKIWPHDDDDKKHHDPEGELVGKKLLLSVRTNHLIHHYQCKLGSHDPQKCRSCVKQHAKMMKSEFLKYHTANLTKDLTDQKIDEHLLKYNPVSLIGNIAAGLPRPTESPSKIWEALLKRQPKTSSC